MLQDTVTKVNTVDCQVRPGTQQADVKELVTGYHVGTLHELRLVLSVAKCCAFAHQTKWPNRLSLTA